MNSCLQKAKLIVALIFVFQTKGNKLSYKKYVFRNGNASWIILNVFLFLSCFIAGLLRSATLYTLFYFEFEFLSCLGVAKEEFVHIFYLMLFT